MKVLFICLLIAIKLPAMADFNTATEAYHNQKFSEAFAIYDQLARIGNKRAQFNLAVMYLKGQYVKADAITAYAWAKLALNPENPEYQQLVKTIEKTLDESSLLAAEAQFTTLDQRYGDAEIYSTLSPITYQPTDKKSSKKPPFKIIPLKRKGPRYPKEALNKSIQGWVTVGFEVHPDGTARHAYVMDAYPENTFEQAAIDAVQKFEFDVQYDPGTAPFVAYARQTIEFTLENLAIPGKLRKFYDERLNQLESLAKQGHAESQYLYGLAASSNIINKDNKMPREEVNHWWLKAAQNGHIEAQFQLGKNIMRGIGCKIEKQKGVDWIVYAAQQGHAKSARKAYQLLARNNHLNNTDQPAITWLKQAADQGDADSQIDYAEYLATQDDQDSSQLILARHYLEKQSDQRKKSVKWYQVSALIYARQNNEKMAKKHQNKAQKLAKKLGWSPDSI